MIKIEVEGLDKLKAAFGKAARNIRVALRGAGDEAARRVVLPTVGLKRYVEKSAANRPGRVKIVRFGGGTVARLRQNYYIRGRGLQVAMRTGGYKQTTSSERLGTQWTVRGERRGGMATEIGNRASYAGVLHGDQQAAWAKARGWRQLADVADEKQPEITAVYQRYVDRALEVAGLK